MLHDLRRLLRLLSLFVPAACLAAAIGCGASHITQVSSKGDQLKFQVDGRPEWLTEEELPKDIDAKELESVTRMVRSTRARMASEEKSRRDQWVRETVEQAAADMRAKLPSGFSLLTDAPYVVAHDGDPARWKELRRVLDGIERRCRDVRGHERALSIGPIRVYYADHEKGYKEAYTSVLGGSPKGFLGVCALDAPPRLFGLASVGAGSLAHELTHVLVLADWDAMPGWMNEGLAVAIGSPKVGFRSPKGSVSDVHLYTAIQAVRQGKWSPLERTFQAEGAAYQDLDRVEVEWPALGGIRTVVGPLATGRMFLRWLDETGALPAFYRAYRDSRQPAAALRAVFPGSTLPEVEHRFRSWIVGHPEPALVPDLGKKD